MQAIGRIIVVQEQRFHLVTDNGQGLLLTVSYHAPIELSDLIWLQRAHARVLVEYTGESNLTSGVAHRISLLSPEVLTPTT